MEVKIGVVHTPKEITVEVGGTADEIVALVEQALETGGKALWLSDDKGRRIGIPADKVAYIEIDTADGSRKVGFGRP